MSISVREATRGDVGLILGLIRELAEYEREPQAVVATEALIATALFGDGARGPVCAAVIGEVDGVAQGFALYFTTFSTWVGRPGVYLEDLFVRPAARGCGLGLALFTHVARIAKARGGRMEWSVLNWNEPAIGFYTRLGARPMSEWTVYRLDGEGLGRIT